MEILPGVGAMGAIPPAVTGTHKLGGGMFLRTEEKSIREVVLHYTMTKQGPTVEELDAATRKPVRVVPKSEAMEMMREMQQKLSSPPPRAPEPTPAAVPEISGGRNA
jgi:hypothetical protein